MKRRHFEVLLENIEKKVDLVFKGHQILDRKIDGISNELKTEMLDMRQFFAGYLDKINDILDNYGQKILTLETKTI